MRQYATKRFNEELSTTPNSPARWTRSLDFESLLYAAGRERTAQCGEGTAQTGMEGSCLQESAQKDPQDFLLPHPRLPSQTKLKSSVCDKGQRRWRLEKEEDSFLSGPSPGSLYRLCYLFLFLKLLFWPQRHFSVLEISPTDFWAWFFSFFLNGCFRFH